MLYFFIIEGLNKIKGEDYMPRKARKFSNTKVYHIILRGNDKQDIFFEEQDYNKFIKEVKNTKEKYKYELFAYCLMTNHVHMVLFDKNDNLSKIMQSLAVSYSSYFSKKYDKVGHLFQNRFYSKCVETREYLIQLCRYIHQNPVKANIARTEEYSWSSYKEYIKQNKITETKMIMSIFGVTKTESIKNFVKFHKIEKEDLHGNDYLEYEMKEKLTDYELEKIIEKLLKINSVMEIKRFNTEIRNQNLAKLKEIKGTSKSQISRVTGINRKIIERVLNNKENNGKEDGDVSQIGQNVQKETSQIGHGKK